MLIGGLQKISLSDYPGKSACVVFTLGCNFRCGFCHNADMVLPEMFPSPISQEEIFDFLKSRVGKLDAVVVCGGEPTIHKDLPVFVEKIKNMGFLVKLDTNGTNPNVIEQLVESKLIDFVAMDVKGPLEKYSSIASRPVDLEAIRASVDYIIKSGIDYEFRTTVVSEQLDIDDFHEIGRLIKGAKRYSIQKFNSEKTLDPAFVDKTAYGESDNEKIKKIMLGYVETCVVH